MTDAWNHVVLLFDLSNGTNANRVISYINGALQTFSAPPTWPTVFTTGAQVELSVGAAANGTLGLAGPAHNANMKDLAIWAGHLATPAEAAELYNGGTTRDPALASFGVPGNLWRLNGDFADYGSGTPRHLEGFSGVTFDSTVPP